MTSPTTLRLEAIVASKTNPRKHFDADALKELAESIAKHGVLQAVLVRPNGADGKFELVAGERRWRAAKIAQLDRIPVTVRELSDTEALELQVVENLQRTDLHPLEEAEGYESLMKCQHADGRTYTADEIAAKVGKSRSYVYQRLKLTALTPLAREAFYTGHLDASRALLVARVPEARQKEALGKVIGFSIDGPEDLHGGEFDDGYVPSFREARDLIRRNFMLDLGKPPFDVQAIYFAGDSTAAIGPPCAECPKRTGNQPELFADVQSGDVCTDPDCFHAKTAAHGERLADEHRAKGLTVLTGKEAHKVMPNTWSKPKGGYLRLDQPLDGDPNYKSLSSRLGKKRPPVTLVAHPSEPGQFIRVVEEKAAREALEKAGFAWAKKPARDTAAAKAPATEKDEERELAMSLALHKAVREAVRRDGLTEADLRIVVKEIYGANAIDAEIEDLAPRNKAGYLDIETAPANELQPLLVDATFCWLRDDNERTELAKNHGLDVKAIEREAGEAWDALLADKAPEKPAKGAKAKKTKAGAK